MNFLKELRWEPTIGDPTFMGWFTVAAYAVAALFAARVWMRGREKLWLFVAIGMAALCVNKQLDLQSLFTAIGRVVAWHGGWFEQRRSYQKWIVLGMLAVSALLCAGFVWRFHAFWLGHKLLSAGVMFLLTFIVVRAVSFHHVDVFLNSDIAGMRMNWLLELGGIFLVGLAAVRESVVKRKSA
ncbi:MAG: hypothetical protein ABIS50_08990 [Luteolibacter sp.]|uniref:hypothetical protein n=1 Tax=Luteolibacter sp. TaxID=1962973 RepID=UPI00326453D5